jgi:transposase
LSDYQTDLKSGKWAGNKIVTRIDHDTGQVLKQKTISILKPENVGPHMAIDDKQLSGDVYTILSNQSTQKIALMIESIRPEELRKALGLLGNIDLIQAISCDMAPSYLKLCKDALPDATIVIDKFHVMQYVLDALQQVRADIKKGLLDQLPKGKRKPENSEILSDLQLLKRCRYSLNQSSDKWSENLISLINELFERFPDIKTAYDLCQSFREWYDKKNQNKPQLNREIALFNWYDMVEKSGLKQFTGVVKMIEKHESEIINYFQTGLTSAKAERLNGSLQRFVTNNYGMRNKDFALYRIQGYFA